MKILNKQNKKNTFFVTGTFLLLVPIISFGAGLVPCGGQGESECNFNFLLILINNIVKFVLFRLAVPIAAIMFAYAGILLLTSGGNTSQKEKSKKIFTGVAIGIVIAAAAWIIVHLIVSVLGCGDSCSWIGF
ncbi:MAG TPA: hypothetical protein PLO44_00585 [Candidatus Paceibacterota bacterium]|nr:hypothetical protein [Candidatus Paceibacterota bacterium]